MGKLISIVVPCYNVERYIDRCMRTLVNQTIGIENLELICVDDASQDGTWEKLLRWERRFPESVLLIRNERNLRQGGARNKGLEYASAPYIGFVDSDDWVHEAMFEKMYDKAVRYQCDMVNCLFKRVLDEGVKLSRLSEDSFFEITSVEDRKLLMGRGLLDNVVWSKIYKRELVFSHDVRFPEGLFFEDNYWSSLIFLYMDNIYFLNEELYYYFINWESTLLKRNDVKRLDRLKIELMKIEEYHKREVYRTYQQEIEKDFIVMYFINTCHTLFNTWDELNIGLYHQLKEQVLRLFPNYKKNEYIKRLPDRMKMILDSLDYVVTQDDLDGLKERYFKS